jgi:hypothetical protein
VQAQIERQREQTAPHAGPSDRRACLRCRRATAGGARVGRAPQPASAATCPNSKTRWRRPAAAPAELLAQVTVVDRCARCATRRIGDRRRHQAEQMLELRGLRGKSGAKVR